MAKYDLLLTNGRILDPSQDIDSVADIAFKNGKVLEIATTLDKEKASQVRDVSGNLVTPGLIDLHTHIYWGGTSIGVDPTDYARRCGTTTMIDAGTAGAGNFAGFKAHIIEPCEPRILAYLNISFAGIFAFSDTVMVGESEDIRLLHPRAFFTFPETPLVPEKEQPTLACTTCGGAIAVQQVATTWSCYYLGYPNLLLPC